MSTHEWGIEYRMAPVPERVVWYPADCTEANVRRILALWLTIPSYEDPSLVKRQPGGKWTPAR